MKGLFRQVAVIGFAALLSTGALAAQTVNLTYSSKRFTKSIDLKKEIKRKYSYNLNNYELKKVEIVAAVANNSDAELALKVGSDKTQYKFLEDGWSSYQNGRYYYTSNFDNPNYDSDGQWKLLVRGSIYAKSIKVTLESFNDGGSYECGYGYHWSNTQNRCVQDGYETDNCPSGYHWDLYANRCVRNNYTPAPNCPAGTHWDASSRRCVRDNYNPTPNCPAGTHWDSYQRRCVRSNYNPTPTPNCPSGTHWDASSRRCVRNSYNPTPAPNCPAGTYWDASSRRCVRSSSYGGNHNCPAGTHWDSARRRCVR